MSLHRYPTASLAGDYARGGIGMLLTAGPLMAVPMHPIVAWLLAGAAVLFIFFLGRTVLRHATVIEADDQGITARGPVGRTIPWPALKDVRLRYYSTRRDREQGWMQLTLRGHGRRLTVESSIEDFDTLAGQAAAMARRNGVTLSDATLNNMMALGAVPASSGLAERWGLTPDEASEARADDDEPPLDRLKPTALRKDSS